MMATRPEISVKRALAPALSARSGLTMSTPRARKPKEPLMAAETVGPQQAVQFLHYYINYLI